MCPPWKSGALHPWGEGPLLLRSLHPPSSVATHLGAQVLEPGCDHWCWGAGQPQPASPLPACPRPAATSPFLLRLLFRDPVLLPGRLSCQQALLHADSQLLSGLQLFCCWLSRRSKCQITGAATEGGEPVPPRPGHRQSPALGTCPAPGGLHTWAQLPLFLFLLFLSWWVCAKPRGLGLGWELMKEEVGSLFPGKDDPREVPAEVWSGEGGGREAPQHTQLLGSCPTLRRAFWLTSPTTPTCTSGNSLVGPSLWPL